MPRGSSGGQDPHREHGVEVRLIGGFSLRRGSEPVELPPVARRLVALLALHPRGCDRARATAGLWPDLSPPSGSARMRGALYRVGRVDPVLLRPAGTWLSLDDGVHVDVRRARRVADDVLAERAVAAGPVPVGLFGADLLPGWDDDWLVDDREDFARVRVRVLERLARDAIDEGRYHDAERACRTVTAVEPYRESAHRLLAEVYLAEGNGAQALQQLVAFQHRLHRDLGVAAGEDLRRLAGSIRAAVA